VTVQAPLVLLIILGAALTGCVNPVREFCDPAHDLSETVVESSTESEVTYRVTVNGGKSNAGQNVSLSTVGPDFVRVTGDKGTLDDEGRLTMRITVPISWDRAELQTVLGPGPGEDLPCGSTIVNPDIDTLGSTPGSNTVPDEPTDPTSTAPTSEPQPCITNVVSIETDREHFTGESDAIYRVTAAGDLPDGARVRGTVNGAPVEGHVIDGVAELRHRVYAYGEYTLTDIEIVADGCTHDHEQDAQTSATADVS